MNVYVPDDCAVVSREAVKFMIWERDEARKQLQQALARASELERERDEARDRCRALDSVETELWELGCACINTEGVPKAIKDKAAEWVHKYDVSNPPDLPWLDEPTKRTASENPQPDLFTPCYNPPGWVDPDTDPDVK